VIGEYERGTVAEVYKQIESDLQIGLTYLDENAFEKQKLHWNIKSANTFAARFYSLKGDFEKVLVHTNGVFSTHPSRWLRDLNHTYNMLDIKERMQLWGRTTEKCNFLITPQYSNWFTYFFGTYQYAMNYDFYNQVFKNPFCGGEWIWDIYGVAPDYHLVKWGYHTEKDGLNSEVGYYMIMNVIFDAEEALFLKMEANAMLDNYSAVRDDLDTYLFFRLKAYNPLINKVTEENLAKKYAEVKANFQLNPFYEIPETARTYLNCLYDLRRKEFYYTGMRWFDIRRFRTQVTHYLDTEPELVLAPDDLRRQLQIPTSALSYDIEANPR